MPFPIALVERIAAISRIVVTLERWRCSQIFLSNLGCPAFQVLDDVGYHRRVAVRMVGARPNRAVAAIRAETLDLVMVVPQ